MTETKVKREEQDVTVCLQLDDGSRVNGSYKPSKTLYDMIVEMCPEKSQENPVLIYMRSEIFGDALKSESLKSLGVSGGRVLLRLINSKPEDLKVQANVSAPLPQKLKMEVEQKSKSVKLSDVGPSGAFQFKNVAQLSENIVETEVKMEVEEPEKEKIEEKKSEVEVNQKVSEDIKPDPVDETPQIPPVINILDSRGTIIFSLDSIQTASLELPDSFFELTESDVRMLYRDLRKQVDENENAPLMTSELRKLEENKKILNQLAAYKHCALRIQLPNRFVIQTKFSIVEKVEAVYDFLREFLVDSNLDFYLYLTPPKTILDKDLTLVEAKCVPSALLHFGTENVSSFTELLKPEIYEQQSSGSGASHVLLSSKLSRSEASTSGESSSSKPPVPTNFMESKVSSKPTGTVPKWF